MSITLDGIDLPADMEWSDQWTHSQVRQATEITLSGAVVIEEAARQGARPITLEGGAGASWITRATLDALHAAAQIAGKTMTLDYHGTAYTVRFRHADGAISARQVMRTENPGPDHYFEDITIRLMESPA